MKSSFFKDLFSWSYRLTVLTFMIAVPFSIGAALYQGFIALIMIAAVTFLGVFYSEGMAIVRFLKAVALAGLLSAAVTWAIYRMPFGEIAARNFDAFWKAVASGLVFKFFWYLARRRSPTDEI